MVLFMIDYYFGIVGVVGGGIIIPSVALIVVGAVFSAGWISSAVHDAKVANKVKNAMQ